RLTGGRPHTAPYPAVVEFRKGLLEAGQVVLAARLLEQAVHLVAVHDQRSAGVLCQLHRKPLGRDIRAQVVAVLARLLQRLQGVRSEERRVGKVWRSRWGMT